MHSVNEAERWVGGAVVGRRPADRRERSHLQLRLGRAFVVPANASRGDGRTTKSRALSTHLGHGLFEQVWWHLAVVSDGNTGGIATLGPLDRTAEPGQTIHLIPQVTDDGPSPATSGS